MKRSGEAPELRVRKAASLLRRTARSDEPPPWRRSGSAYHVFLAEFLLVRTRWDVVAERFEEVVARFPDFKALAAASEQDIARALAPFGLRKRVPYLKKAAVYVLENFGGHLPRDVGLLKKIPGIGEYTAQAIAALAFGERALPADTNVFRFLSRLTWIPVGHPTKGSPELRALLPCLSEPEGGPSFPALLDFLRTVCRPRDPSCPTCSLRSICEFGRRRSS